MIYRVNLHDGEIASMEYRKVSLLSVNKKVQILQLIFMRGPVAIVRVMDC